MDTNWKEKLDIENAMLNQYKVNFIEVLKKIKYNERIEHRRIKLTGAHL